MKKIQGIGRELPPARLNDTGIHPSISWSGGQDFVFDTLALEDIRAISKGFRRHHQ